MANRTSDLASGPVPDEVAPELVAAVGRFVRERRANRFTLAQLSELSGVSIGLLSNLENGSGNPSLRTLLAIAKALDVDVNAMLAATQPRAWEIVRAEERLEMHLPGTASSLRAVDLGMRTDVAVFVWHLPQGFSGKAVAHVHPGDEFHLVRTGKVRVHVAEEVHELDRGDSIVFDAARPHWLQNTHRGPAELFTVMSPACTPLQAMATEFRTR